jgi:hypothetical protein
MVRAVIEGFAGAVGGAWRRGGERLGRRSRSLSRDAARRRTAGEGLFDLATGAGDRLVFLRVDAGDMCLSVRAHNRY